MNSHTYVVIMAGGIGSRFWPLSRTPKPKQFLDILGVGRTMIQSTFDRFSNICSAENFYVITSQEYKDLVKEQLPQIPENNIIGEPARRNTAPCIAYATQKIKTIDPLATMVVTPADHIVLNTQNFEEIIKEGLDFASSKMVLLTIGIKPSRPETGYGYIQMEDSTNEKHIHKVKTFTEKPDIEMAKVFVESGEFLWNAGIFIWNVKSIVDAFRKHLPQVFLLFEETKSLNTKEEQEFIKDVYNKVESISIDFGIMEKSSDVFVMPADFGWSDLGTWGSLYSFVEKDENQNAIITKNAMLHNSNGCLVNVTSNKYVIGNNLKNLIIAEADGLLLISDVSEEHNIRQIVNNFYIERGENF